MSLLVTLCSQLGQVTPFLFFFLAWLIFSLAFLYKAWLCGQAICSTCFEAENRIACRWSAWLSSGLKFYTHGTCKPPLQEPFIDLYRRPKHGTCSSVGFMSGIAAASLGCFATASPSTYLFFKNCCWLPTKLQEWCCKGCDLFFFLFLDSLHHVMAGG